VNVLFQALDEPSFSVAYASMCKYMLQVNIFYIFLLYIWSWISINLDMSN